MSTDDPALPASQSDASNSQPQQDSLITEASAATPSAPTQPSTLDPAPSGGVLGTGTGAPSDLDAALPPTDAVEDGDADLDVQISTDPIPDPMNLDGASDVPPPTSAPLPNGTMMPSSSTNTNNNDNDNNNDSSSSNGPAVIEARIPQKKDATLREFLGKLDDYTPLIPDTVTDYYLTVAGLPPPPDTDRRLARLLALATQKFIADVAADAYQYSRIRSTNTTSNNPLTGLGGAAAFGTMNMPPPTQAAGGGEGGEGAGGKGKKDAGKAQPLGGPRAGYGGGGAGGAGQGRTVLTMEDLGMAVGEYGVNVKRGEFYR